MYPPDEERRPGGDRSGDIKGGEPRHDGTTHGLPVVEYAIDPVLLRAYDELGQLRAAAVRCAEMVMVRAALLAAKTGATEAELYGVARAQHEAIVADLANVYLATVAQMGGEQ
jgi:hypothetical protein